jgi:hypothetical protein
VLNDIALCHLQKQGLKAVLAERLQTNLFAGDDWAAYLDHLDIGDERHRRIATEAALLGGLVAKGIHPMLAIVSDGAGQFDILEHGLCWVHTERLVHKLIPSNAAQRGEQERLRGEIWAYYADLKAYRAAPAPENSGGAERAIRIPVRPAHRLGDAGPSPQAYPTAQGRPAPGAGTTGHAAAHQRQRDRHPGLRQGAQNQRRHPQRPRPPVPRHLRQSEENLPKARCLLLGLSHRPP